jgi:MFS superfamily sulfate permease-like transporter
MIMTNAKLLATLPRDCFAGVTVFLVALPLCLGIAQASGVNALAGLLAGVIGGLVVALLSGSRLSVSGPAAGLIAIVTQGIADVGGFPAFLSAVFLAGVVQFCFGTLKMGRFAGYMPSSVIKGMLAGIGLLLIMKQTPGAFDWLHTDAPAVHRAAPGHARLETPLGSVSMASSVLAVLSFAVLWAWDAKWLRQRVFLGAVPAPLVVVLLGIAGTLLFDAFLPELALSAEQRVDVSPLDSLASLGQVLSAPDFSSLGSFEVWRLALTLAIVASVETLLSLEAIEQMDPKRQTASPERELKAQGVGNMLAALVGALPITAVIVRSSANLNAGAVTRASAWLHGFLLLASLFALTSVLNLIPLACLAAILIATGMKLAKPSLLWDSAKGGIDRLLPFAATVVGVVTIDLLTGVVIGLASAAVFALRVSLVRAFSLEKRGDVLVLHFRKDATCFVRGALKERLAALPDATTLIVDASCVDTLDADVRECIVEFERRCTGKGGVVRWEAAHVPAPAQHERLGRKEGAAPRQGVIARS